MAPLLPGLRGLAFRPFPRLRKIQGGVPVCPTWGKFWVTQNQSTAVCSFLILAAYKYIGFIPKALKILHSTWYSHEQFRAAIPHIDGGLGASEP